MQYSLETVQEPPLTDVLGDPIIRLLMGYDCVGEDDISALAASLEKERNKRVFAS